MLLRIDGALKNANLLRVTQTVPCCQSSDRRFSGKNCSAGSPEAGEGHRDSVQPPRLDTDVSEGWHTDVPPAVAQMCPQGWHTDVSPGLPHRCAPSCDTEVSPGL